MAQLTPKEFAALIGITYNNLATYLDRNKFAYTLIDGKKWVDTELPINSNFIKERKHAVTKKEKLQPVNKETQPISKPVKDKTGTDLPGAKPVRDNAPKQAKNDANIEIFDLKQQHAAELLRKTQWENFKLELQTSKMSGEMVPHALVQPIVFQCLQYIHAQQKIADESFLSEVAHKYDLTPDDMAYYRSIFINGRNAAITTSSNQLIADLDSIMDVYKSNKTTGERGLND